jgi:GT2 family glycosyltransferase
MSLRVSVVIATYNRGPLLCDLLGDLARQTLPPATFEVVVIDDGSKESAEVVCAGLDLPYACTIKQQKNQGPAAARDDGIGLSQGEIVVIVDDDMRLEADFLAQHVAAHDAGATVVLGLIAPAPQLASMPIFERFHAAQLERFVQGVRAGTEKVQGISLCTGNVSFRRAEYLRLGGFDRSLGRSEDRELGVRFEKNGNVLRFAEAAKTVHASDHANLDVWLKRALQYGMYDRRIAQKHPDVESADPWRFLFLIHPVSRLLMGLPILTPRLGDCAARLVMQAALWTDGLGLEKVAIRGTTLAYGLQYFRGVRQDAGSLRQTTQELAAYWHKRWRSNTPAEVAPS